MGSQVLGVCFLGLSLVFFLGALRLPYMLEFSVGPGFFPLWISAVMGLFSLIVIVSNTQYRKTRLGEIGTVLKASGPAIACLLFIGVFLEKLGFLLTSFLIVAALIFASRKHRLIVVIGIALGFVVFIYVVFVQLLGLNLGR